MRQLLLSCDTERDTEQDLPREPLSQKGSTWRGIFGYIQSGDLSVAKAFKDAFYDLTSFGKRHKNDRRFELSLIRQVLCVGSWNLSVPGLLIYLCLLPLDFSDEESPCQPDGEFRFDGIDRRDSFDWWAPRGFFQITLGWGRLSFGTVKLIDVIWDLVVGRGDQTLVALVSWRVFVEHLQLSLITKPAAYSTVWLIRVVTKPSTARKPISVTKHWTGHPSTYVKALYLPTPFYWNWTANFTGMASSTPLNPYRHSSELTFLVEDEVYNVKDVQDEGICQPIRSGESVEYQWGFSFLQLFVMTVLLHSWSIGLVVLWTTARLTLKRNNIAASPEGWKSLLKMTDGIKEQLMSAGMIWENLTDKELQGEIRLLLTGGPVPISSEESHPEKTLPQGHFSLWRWMWKHKLRLLEGIFFIVFTCLENFMLPLLDVRCHGSRSCLAWVLFGSMACLFSWFFAGKSCCLICHSCSL
ncbi:hypothetical protein FOC4_g10013335 [Fusarium odoratissimum]|uniref:Uncharacterized protein n=1 Tax=Fusarium oxysporum f. sp. cubense (strain race 4) TaxID=2502994 RepID=N1RFG1_FUSC4|nr:hypothetical protein FOC4_g10013335 [Fusarium odoratissimum]